jgi:hypothetical protein
VSTRCVNRDEKGGGGSIRDVILIEL